MRVLIVTNFGVALIEERGPLISALRDKGHTVVFAAPAEDPDARAKLAGVGAEFYQLDIDRAGTNPLRDLAFVAHLARCVRRVRPDMILAISSKPVVYCGLVARLFPRVLVCSILNGLGYVFSGDTVKHRLLAGVTRFLYRLSLARNSLVFFHNSDDLAEFVARGVTDRRRGRVMNGSGVDLQRFAMHALPGRGHFLLIARLLADKGVLEYAAAARRVHLEYPDARFRLVGWFDLVNPTAISPETVATWVAAGDIEFLGFQEDVRPILEDTDVYVLPSRREGLSRTICEAMAMGRPIITSDAPGCRQTVDEGRNGFLVPVGDVSALTSALSRFLADPALAAKLGAESRRLAVERYEVGEVNAALVSSLSSQPTARTSLGG